ncbi:MAG: VOC family protein [Phycisphaerae bacterium]
MAEKVKPIPEGFHTLTPHIVVRDGSRAIDLYKKAFGAEEVARMPSPDGKIMHAELKIGDSIMMLCDEFPDMGVRSPQASAGSPVTLHIYTADVDAAIEKAVAAGATVTLPAQDMFWGDRYGKLKDAFGHSWSVATHKRKTSRRTKSRDARRQPSRRRAVNPARRGPAKDRAPRRRLNSTVRPFGAQIVARSSKRHQRAEPDEASGRRHGKARLARGPQGRLNGARQLITKAPPEWRH